MTGQGKVWLPYEEAIVRFIQNVTPKDLPFLAGIIRGVRIQTGHDEIIKAWKKRLEELGYRDDTTFDVTGDILDQKQVAKKEAAAKAAKEAADGGEAPPAKES